jgi:hypothetical protein
MWYYHKAEKTLDRAMFELNNGNIEKAMELEKLALEYENRVKTYNWLKKEV